MEITNIFIVECELGMLSTSILPDIVEYPDSNKHYALSAKGEMLFQKKHGEPAKYWDVES